MARKIRQKPFDPKPLQPGAAIKWTHYYPTGKTRERTGTVVGRAPDLGPGHKAEVWVVADEPLDSDIYAGGVVVVATRTKNPGYGVVGGYATPKESSPGEIFSDNLAGSATGSLAVQNSRLSWEARKAREAVAA